MQKLHAHTILCIYITPKRDKGEKTYNARYMLYETCLIPSTQSSSVCLVKDFLCYFNNCYIDTACLYGSVCLCVLHMCAATRGDLRRSQTPWIYWQLWPGWHGCWELNQGPQPEERVLTAGPSPAPPGISNLTSDHSLLVLPSLTTHANVPICLSIVV